MVVTRADDRLRDIRDRWQASREQIEAARTAVDRRDLGLANPRDDIEERRARLGRRHHDADGEPRAEDRWPLAPDDFFVTDPVLDHTLVAVALRDGRPPGDAHGSIPLIEQTGKAVIGEVLNVVHHPGGERKRVSIRFNRMVAEDDLWLRYESDTREGSSGAPVFNDQWEKVALHHGGITATDDDGFDLARDGRRWTPGMGEHAVAYVGNEGARVSRIVRSLRTADVPPEHRPLLDPVLGEEQ